VNNLGIHEPVPIPGPAANEEVDPYFFVIDGGHIPVGPIRIFEDPLNRFKGFAKAGNFHLIFGT
jgi:hypothetical protein